MGSFIYKHVSFRPFSAPTIDLPFGVRSLGLYEVTGGWHDIVKRINFMQLQWCIEGELIISANGKNHTVPAHHVMYLRPGEMLAVKSRGPTRYRWLTLDGRTASTILSHFGRPQEPWRAGSCPGHLFDQLAREVLIPTPGGQHLAATTAFNILSRATNPQAGSSTQKHFALAESAYQILLESFSDSSLNVNTIADQLGVHRSTLSRLFHRHYGTTLIESLISMRIQTALSLLQETGRPIAEISRRVGYDDPNYFCRLFSKRLGCSPKDFRKSAI